jgi:N-acetylglucosamine-6-phosphate deacetylase
LPTAGAVRGARDLIGASLEDALAMATATPARFLGLNGSHGHLAPGRRADFVELDGSLQVRRVWIQGVCEPA